MGDIAKRVYQNVKQGCEAYLEQYPSASLSHDQQANARYCLKLLAGLDTNLDDALFEKHLAIVLADVNKKLREKHNLTFAHIASRIVSFGTIGPADTSRLKCLVEDGLCNLFNKQTLTYRLNSQRDAAYPMDLTSTKRGDIEKRYHISVAEQEAFIQKLDTEIPLQSIPRPVVQQ